MVEVGARWWAFDFHTHTPASMDYGRAEVQLRGTMTPRDWLLSFVEKGIECVAVTDHNTGGWVNDLKREAELLRGEGKSIYVFPGVEITANGNVHILAIFDPDKTSEDIAAVVGAAKFRGQFGNSDAVAEESPENIVEEIIRSGGVAIPAHIDMKAGMCHIQSAQTIGQICRKASAVEIIFPQGGRSEEHDELIRKYRAIDCDLAEVIGSDSHHPNEVGRAYTWIKMSKPTIEGVRLALVDGSSSVKRSEQVVGDPNAVSSSVIKSISISNAKYCGRGKALEIKFNPWLNSIIGGRGSGKSSILEFMRIGFGRSKDLLEIPGRSEVKDTFSRFAQKSDSRDADGVLLDDTVIQCIIKKEGAYYLLKWVFGAKNVEIFRWDGAAWGTEQGDARSRFPIKIFSQKQIYDLAKNPSALIRLIDESDSVDMFGWKMQWDDKSNHFFAVCGQRREQQAKLSNKGVLLGQLADVNQKIELIESSGHAKILSAFNSASAKEKVLREYVSSFSSLGAGVLGVLRTTAEPVIDVSSFDAGSEVDLELLESVKALSRVHHELREGLESLIKDAEEKVNGFSAWLEGSRFSAVQNSCFDEYKKLVDELTRKGVDNPSEYQQLVESRAEIQRKIDELSSVEAEVAKLTDQINSAYTELIGLRKELTTRRMGFIKRYFAGNSSIELKLEPLCNVRDMEESFRALIGRADGAFSGDIYDQEKGGGFLFALSQRLQLMAEVDFDKPESLSKIFDVVHSFKADIFGFSNGQIFGCPIGKRFSDFMAQLPPHSFDRLNLWFPDDQLVVRYNDGKRLRDISQGSAGQKAATILSFLLSYGSEPLILDQPEDDLDNGLISSLIVSKLQENKARRQVVVVTHNPNIVVNGDSELVIALQDKGNIVVSASGGLQEVSVRKEVCEIMEGGKLALQQRYRRMIAV
ncbi:TPA: TrlF family AAA-like ATPase [Pseudomonas aeruginosa]